MHKAKKWRLIPGGVKRAVAFAMSAFLLAGSLSLDSLAAEGVADVSSTSNSVFHEELDMDGANKLDLQSADGGSSEDSRAADPSEPDGFIATTANKDVTYTFDFADYQAAIYDLKEGVVDDKTAADARSPMKTGTVGLVNVITPGFYCNSHGFGGKTELEFAVAGNCRIDIAACTYSGGSGQYTMSSQTGTIVAPSIIVFK